MLLTLSFKNSERTFYINTDQITYMEIVKGQQPTGKDYYTLEIHLATHAKPLRVSDFNKEELKKIPTKIKDAMSKDEFKKIELDV